MAFKVKNAERDFILKRECSDDNVKLADPNINMEPKAVQRFYSGEYPELTSCTITGPKMRGGKAVYTFETIIGEKG